MTASKRGEAENSRAGAVLRGAGGAAVALEVVRCWQCWWHAPLCWCKEREQLEADYKAAWHRARLLLDQVGALGLAATADDFAKYSAAADEAQAVGRRLRQRAAEMDAARAEAVGVGPRGAADEGLGAVASASAASTDESGEARGAEDDAASDEAASQMGGLPPLVNCRRCNKWLPDEAGCAMHGWCPRCFGTGRRMGGACPTCRGTGWCSCLRKKLCHDCQGPRPLHPVRTAERGTQDDAFEPAAPGDDGDGWEDGGPASVCSGCRGTRVCAHCSGSGACACIKDPAEPYRSPPDPWCDLCDGNGDCRECGGMGSCRECWGAG